jgi:hypothetical protein
MLLAAIPQKTLCFTAQCVPPSVHTARTMVTVRTTTRLRRGRRNTQAKEGADGSPDVFLWHLLVLTLGVNVLFLWLWVQIVIIVCTALQSNEQSQAGVEGDSKDIIPCKGLPRLSPVQCCCGGKHGRD